MNYLQIIIGWYFTKRVLPYWCVWALDCMIVGVSEIIVQMRAHNSCLCL